MGRPFFIKKNTLQTRVKRPHKADGINRRARPQKTSCARLEASRETFEINPLSPGDGLTTKDEKRILEISQSTTDFWKIDFRAKNPVGLKFSKTARNGITKRINVTASILFFTRVREKGEKSRRFEKIACEPRLGAGTERQSQSTKIPVRGRKLEPVFGFERRRYVRVPKSPQGDGNRTPLLSLTQRDFAR